MLDKPTAPLTLGLDFDDFSLKGASLKYSNKKIEVDEVFDYFLDLEPSEDENVKRFYIDEKNRKHLNDLSATHLVITAVNSKDVLVRSLDTLLTKNKDIDDALHFQVEPILPYPLDQAVLDKILLYKDKEGSKLSVFILRKDHLLDHLAKWNDLGIESEIVSADSIALTLFANYFSDSDRQIYALHIGIENSFCVLIDQKKLIAAQAIPAGIKNILNLYNEETHQDFKTTYEQFKERKLSLQSNLFSNGQLKEAVETLRLSITRTIYALAKASKSKDIDNLLITGPGTLIAGLKEAFAASLNKTLIEENSKNFKSSNIKSYLDYLNLDRLPIETKNKILDFSSKINNLWQATKQKLLSKYDFFQKNKVLDVKESISLDDQLIYALPIGEALSGLTNVQDQINFRQNEFAFPEPWKRLKKPIIQYFVCLLLVALTTLIFGKAYIHYQEGEIKNQYTELLEAMNKPYQKFEKEYQNKTHPTKDQTLQEIPPLSLLSSKDIENRLAVLEKDLKSTPQTFPLQPNAPLAIDTLTWIINQFILVQKRDGVEDEDSFHIENFSYTMVKRPEPLKKQEKYQIKVELEFSSIKPKLAREFHDILIAPNDLVDTKAEIKWGSNKDRYRTSFYLKDKTIYPN